MQTSNPPSALPTTEDQPQNAEEQTPPSRRRYSFLFIFSNLLTFAVLGLWIMQNSVNAYYQQTYHQPSPLAFLDDYALWHKGQEIGETLYKKHDQVQLAIQKFNQHWVDLFNQEYAYTAEFKQQQALKAEQQRLLAQQRAAAQAKQALLDQFRINKQQQVFFAGDSLMQGVAPHVQKYLQENYQVNTVNLSKQSTGLSYPSFFNWPKTIQETLQSNPNIKILVVFLGPNDPWDMANPAGGRYLKFQSPDWEALYRSRIADIFQTAQQHQVSVMWISPPNMRKDSLNQQMIYLNQVITDEVKKHHGYVIDSRALLGSQNNVYSDYRMENGVSSKTRSADGIHFSVEGQKIVAAKIAENIHVVS
ncbi:SGNH/GDSL hydrolase family protein [Acinetobacter larvae]|uniref:Uncharacterized protein n=1 Tax=Acinetobacter larvae TaxID=1789224 RepID=A0A1B2M2B4_9GAMM|nr:SGNH family hydrolase [Acinetobacter larvae]AOA59328.1 hypothetical protein BFG52_13825 [Acinetobacter larvae]